MPLILTYLLSLQWAYLDDPNIQGWFANEKGKPKYSLYYDKNAKALAAVFWSQHPRETIPLAWVLDNKGFRVQPQVLRSLDPLREIQQ